MQSKTILRSAAPRLAAAGFFAVTALCAAMSTAHAVPAISLSPSATSVLPNQAFTVDVLASGFSDLYGYQFSVSYDPSRFIVSSVTAGSFLASAGSTFFSPGTIDSAAGNVSFVFETLTGAIDGVNGSGLLGTINLSALGTFSGSGSIGLFDVGAVNSTLDNISLAAVDPALVSAVSAVPEPETYAMMLLGLAGVYGMQRRRKGAARG